MTLLALARKAREHHQFFCCLSPEYSGMTIMSNPFQVSRAWARYMYFSLRDEWRLKP